MEKFGKDAQKERIEIPEIFPIVSAEEQEMWFDNETDEGLLENQIIFYTRSMPSKTLKGFKLLRTIGKHEYIFRCSESLWGYFSLDFKTRGHEYARTQLTSEEVDELGKIIKSFVESIKDTEYARVDRINVSPASQSYTVEETERCKREILDTLKTKFEEKIPFSQDSKEEYLNGLPPFKVFELYQELSGSDFERDTTKVSMAAARSRLFRNLLEKYLPDWQIDGAEDTYPSSEFQIIPRKF